MVVDTSSWASERNQQSLRSVSSSTELNCSFCYRLEALGACQPDIALYSEVVADAAAEQLFPINALRNAALLLARTELVMLGGRRWWFRFFNRWCPKLSHGMQRS